MNAEARHRDPADATVLICSRDRRTMLLETVRSVLAAAAVPRELLVVDQSQRPNTELAAMDRVRQCHVRYLQSSTEGLSRARNIGLREASSDVVVLLDDDMLVEDHWLPLLLDGLRGGSRRVATGRVLPAPSEGHGETVPAAALVTRETPERFSGPQHLDVVPGANVALPREVVLELGGFDERLGAGTRFGSADDNDMGYRLLLAGCEVRHVPAAVVLHRAWRTPGDLVRLRWRYARGKGAFYAKHIGFGDTHMLRRARSDLVGRVRRALTCRSPRGTVAELLSVAGTASGALEWLVRERIFAHSSRDPATSRCGRRRGQAEG